MFKRTPLSFAILTSLATASFTANAVELETVTVTETTQNAVTNNTLTKEQINEQATGNSDLVDIIANNPSVSVNQAGGFSGFPVIRGLADSRLNIQVDGMQLIASCPNHMNTPLSYVAPSQAESVEVYPGITPVSVGGDSIGGAILVKTEDPIFAPAGEQITQGEAGAYYRSNGKAKGANLTVTTASDKLNLTYKGTYADSENYTAASDFKSDHRTTTLLGTTNPAAGTEFTDGVDGNSINGVDEVAGTAYQTSNHQLSMAYKADDNSVLKAAVIIQDTPYEQYPNQRMDMTGNQSTKFNIGYDKPMSWGDLSVQAYSETVDHVMAFMDYKIQTQMPMATETDTQGFKVRGDINVSDSSSLNVGVELQRFSMDDYWEPNPASYGMSPNTFWNINDGSRDRNAIFAEWEKTLNAQWNTRLGARLEQVTTNAGDVAGYHTTDTFDKTDGDLTTTPNTLMKTNEATEAAAFNALDHKVTDNNLNLTALATYKQSETFKADFGLARQVRSPDLYERYTWSTWSMAAVMNNFVGDGNGYVGDINLKPETAYTISTNLDWHSADKNSWGVQVMPYYSHIEDYIDAQLVNPAMETSTFNVLQYVNQTARIYGIDIATNMQLANNAYGNWSTRAVINYARGENTDTNDNLYNIMPLNATVTLMQKLNRWNNAVEVIMVSSKEDVSDVRNELQTAGYSLVNLKTSYSVNNLRVDFGIDNLFDKAYDLPTGGAYTGEGKTMSMTGIPLMSVPGMGRSLYLGMNYKF